MIPPSRILHLKNIPLAIFANKVDLIDCTEEDLANFMGINSKMSRVLSIFKTSAFTGEGIHKGIYWLADAIQEGKHASMDLYQVKSLFDRASTIMST